MAFLFFFTSVLLMIASPEPVSAYIGPGAGFAVAGSFLVMLTAIVSTIVALLTWPLRGLIHFIRFRKIYARSRFKKIVIVGFDGMDYSLTKKWMEEGKLPNFSRLKELGTFKPLQSTIPPISPVAWSAFQTGTNPGKTNIFDFLTRDRISYAIKLSSVDIKPPKPRIGFGKFIFPLGDSDIRLLRKSIPFWKIIGDKGFFSSIIRVPITFPPEKFNGVQLSGMCVPDLRGSQGTFSFFTTRAVTDADQTGGETYTVKKTGKLIHAELMGPPNPVLKEKKPMTCPFRVKIKNNREAELQLGRNRYHLQQGVYSKWITVKFRAFPGIWIAGICRFLPVSLEPDFDLYVTPIHLHPDKPAMPISHPPIYATYLSKRQGYYGTLGLAEDSWALNSKKISDAAFYEQCLQGDMEREKMLMDSIKNIHRGLCVCVFDGTDRVQHAFWREMDEQHPIHQGNYRKPEKPAIEAVYQHADAVLGRILQRCQNNNTLLFVISDHGFSGFRYGIDLNRWLEENGYLKLKNSNRGARNFGDVDWTTTKAYAVGLAGLFINLKGRESQGIVDPEREASVLRDEIAGKLIGLEDHIRKQRVVKQVYNAWQTYRGPYRIDAPDLIVGYQAGYRASWDTAVGRVTDRVFHDNIKAWSGDHCIDRSLVPGVLFCNRMISTEAPRLVDMAPTVLEAFGVQVPAHMDGRALTIERDRNQKLESSIP